MTRLGRDAADWQRAEQRSELRRSLARAIYAPPRPLGLIRWYPAVDGSLVWYGSPPGAGRYGVLPP